MSDIPKVNELARNLASIHQARDHIAKGRDALIGGLLDVPMTHENLSAADTAELKKLQTRLSKEAGDDLNDKANKMITAVDEIYGSVINDIQRAAQRAQALRDLPRRNPSVTTPSPPPIDVQDVEFEELPKPDPK